MMGIVWLTLLLLVLAIGYHWIVLGYGKLESPLIMETEYRWEDLHQRVDLAAQAASLELDLPLADWCRQETSDSTSWRCCVGAIGALIRLREEEHGYRQVSQAVDLKKLAVKCYAEHIFPNQQDTVQMGRMNQLNKMLSDLVYVIYDRNQKYIVDMGQVNSSTEFVDLHPAGVTKN